MGVKVIDKFGNQFYFPGADVGFRKDGAHLSVTAGEAAVGVFENAAAAVVVAEPEPEDKPVAKQE